MIKTRWCNDSGYRVLVWVLGLGLCVSLLLKATALVAGPAPQESPAQTKFDRPDLVVDNIFLDEKGNIAFRLRNAGKVVIAAPLFVKIRVRVSIEQQNHDFELGKTAALSPSAQTSPVIDPGGLLRNPKGTILYHTRLPLTTAARVTVFVDFTQQMAERDEKNNRLTKTLTPPGSAPEGKPKVSLTPHPPLDARLRPRIPGTLLTLSVTPESRSFGPKGGTGSIGITAAGPIPWSAESQVTWISVTEGSSGTGSGMTTYVVAANPDPSSRSGRIMIAGLTVTISQSGAELRPDLLAENVDVENRFPFSMRVTVRNDGNGDVNMPFEVEYHTRPDPNGEWKYFGSQTARPLKAGEATNLDFQRNITITMVDMKEGRLRIGENEIKAVADIQNAITNDADPGNNVYQGKFDWRPTLADLQVTSMNLQYSDDYLGETLCALTVRIANRGNDYPVNDAQNLPLSSFTALVVEGQSQETGFRFAEGQKFLDNKNYALAPDSSMELMQQLRLPTEKLDGNFLWRAEFDPERHFADSDRQNNIMTKQIAIPKRAVSISSFSPDLGVTGPNPINAHIIINTPYLLQKGNVKAFFNNQELKIWNTTHAGTGIYDLGVSWQGEPAEGLFTVTANGVSAVSTKTFRVFGPPTLASLEPLPARPGGELIIRGTNFLPSDALKSSNGMAGTTVVIFPGNIWVDRYQLINENEIRVTVPDNAVSGDLEVNMGFNRAQRHLLIMPTLRFIPNQAVPGSEVGAYAKGLRPVEQGAEISFNGVKGIIQRVIDGPEPEMVIRVPPDAPSGDKIRITTADGIDEERSGLFRVVSPEVESIAPESALPGAWVTLKGKDLDLATGVAIYPLILGSRYNLDPVAIEKQSPEELVIRLPTLEKFLARIQNFLERYSSTICKMKAPPEAYMGGPASFSLGFQSLPVQWMDVQGIPFSLLNPAEATPRSDARIAKISSWAPQEAALGEELTLYGEDLDATCQVMMQAGFSDNAVFDCPVIAISGSSKMTIRLPSAEEIRRQITYITPEGMKGPISILLRYVKNIRKIVLDDNLAWTEPVSVSLK